MLLRLLNIVTGPWSLNINTMAGKFNVFTRPYIEISISNTHFQISDSNYVNVNVLIYINKENVPF